MVYQLSLLHKSTLNWRDTREFLIYIKHLLIPHWLTQLWQEHVNDGVHQKKYNRLSRVSEWSTGWNKSLWFRISPQTVLVCSCSRGHCRVTVGACVISLADRVKFLCRQENLCTTHCQVTHKINFKQSFHIKGESCYYVMGSIHLAQEICSSYADNCFQSLFWAFCRCWCPKSDAWRV